MIIYHSQNDRAFLFMQLARYIVKKEQLWEPIFKPWQEKKMSTWVELKTSSNSELLIVPQSRWVVLWPSANASVLPLLHARCVMLGGNWCWAKYLHLTLVQKVVNLYSEAFPHPHSLEPISIKLNRRLKGKLQQTVHLIIPQWELINISTGTFMHYLNRTWSLKKLPFLFYRKFSNNCRSGRSFRLISFYEILLGQQNRWIAKFT